MATTIQPPQIEEELPVVRVSDGSGGGGLRGLVPAEGDLRRVEDRGREGEPTRTGIWVALAAIAMMFAALTSALYVREGASTDWQHIALPRILWFNTLALILSSLTLEVARRKVGAFMRGVDASRSAALLWLNATLFLGLVFVAGQYLAWLTLRAEGLYLPTNPNSSFFYVLTAVHVVHVVGGLGGLLRAIAKFVVPAWSLRRSTLDATSYYWHFMGILWVYLMFILWLKL